MSDHEQEPQPDVELHRLPADPEEPPVPAVADEPDDDEPDFEGHQFFRR